MTFDDLLTKNRRDLHALLVGGHPIDPDRIADTEYWGASIGLPALIDRLVWKKFKKVFRREEDGSLRGWNVRTIDDALSDPWRDDMTGDRRHTYGHYAVRDPAGYAARACYRRGLMIDYGRGGHGPLHPLRRIRDPLVAVNEGDEDLLLGVSFFDAGFAGWWLLPTWFALIRGGPLTYDVPPPGASTRS